MNFFVTYVSSLFIIMAEGTMGVAVRSKYLTDTHSS
jgi:hypothetical protein